MTEQRRSGGQERRSGGERRAGLDRRTGTLMRQGGERRSMLERRAAQDRRAGGTWPGARTERPAAFEPRGAAERRAGQVPRMSGGKAESRASHGQRALDRGATQVPGSPTADSYYGRSILKPVVWRAWIPAYFFTGGVAGASSGLALAAAMTGRRRLTRTASLVALGGLLVSPPLLIADLGRPDRFYNMLRIVKPTSPMNVGTWVLTASGGAVVTAAASEFLPLPRRLRLSAHVGAALLGLPLSTYTAALLADTAVPAWHDARRELPLVFAGSAAAAAGGIAWALVPHEDGGPARILALGGAALEVGAGLAMERSLGPLIAEPYRTGTSGLLARASRVASVLGAVLLTFGGRRRRPAVIGGALMAAGSLAERFAVQTAGIASARDPRYVVEPQRARLGRGAAAAGSTEQVPSGRGRDGAGSWTAVGPGRQPAPVDIAPRSAAAAPGVSGAVGPAGRSSGRTGRS